MDRNNVSEVSSSKGDKKKEKTKKISVDITALIKYYNKAIECNENILILEGNEMDIKYAYYTIIHNLEKLNLVDKFNYNKETKMFDNNE